MNINNLYNFKNPIKHFCDIDSIIFPEGIDSVSIKNLSWTEPINFRIKKNEEKYRTLKMPNVLNFVAAYEYFKDLPNFEYIQKIDKNHKRLSANVKTGDFKTGEFNIQLEIDFQRLCIYDVLVKVDIKEYYGRIYTHYIDLKGHNEQFLSNMNLGATNGLIMGNYLSLYLAEVNLSNISKDIENKISELNVNCKFSYFSDDFYFFCNKNDIETIIKIFDEVLEKYDLERNDAKKEIWTYETFNNYNIVQRNWKKLIANCNVKFNKDSNKNKLCFINQLIYRMSKLPDEKLKRIFINNFFKTKYFQELEMDKYSIKSYDYHQLCFIFKYSPESMLYSINKFNQIDKFNENTMLYNFFNVRYEEALVNNFYDEQLYYYFAIKRLGFIDLLIKFQKLIINTKNQILISYYLKDNLFVEDDIMKLRLYEDERYWFQNYHMILYSDELKKELEKNIKKYLIPKYAVKDIQKNFYMNFYKKNIQLNIPMIRDIEQVQDGINEYLLLKIEENQSSFEEEN
ncbi:hypothetical protein [Clostridium perfringens]|uniref:hypothetical protein n=1 Tax=Clostridium perfringens TaxID=1502 RepID=UPI001A2EC627|nr:hypothetical protein CPBEC5_00580 [Clostridium perfringens]HAT4315417.1 hypothetical protein [Clostridium perfringens]HCG3019774.1 hypothetical protein [Clostridium perfringens]